MRDEKSAAGCGTFGYYMKNIIKFLLSHIGLVSLVVGYTIIGGWIFEKLEAGEELNVKKSVTATRKKVTDDLWDISENSDYFKEEEWAEKVRTRLQKFEIDLVKAIKNKGWDGNEELDKQQWTFPGALFYSIILITTIGYGHIAPKTAYGKLATIFYAIPGVPLMMLCLANIGDGMAQSFRFLYWKVCCYVCTKKPKRKRRSKSSRALGRSRYPSSGPASSIRGRSSSFRRSARASQRSADSHLSDSAFYSNYDTEGRLQDDALDPSVDPKLSGRSKARVGGEDVGGGRVGSMRARCASDASPNARLSQQGGAGDHLKLPSNEEEENRSSVLFNKYALEKEGGPAPEDLPSVHDGKRSLAAASEPPTEYRAIDQDLEAERDRQRDRDTRFREPEILVTRAPKNSPGSLRGPPRPGYPDSPSASLRDPLGYYPTPRPVGPPSDPRVARLSRLEEEYYYADDYYYDGGGGGGDGGDYDDDSDDDDDADMNADKPVPIWLGVLLVVAYIFSGASLFTFWETWNYLDAVYFCFITLTTIGFGDFVPAQDKKDAQLRIALCSTYLLFGIALLAMAFNLVQEEVITNVKRVAKRLGIIKEEGVVEEGVK